VAVGSASLFVLQELIPMARDMIARNPAVIQHAEDPRLEEIVRELAGTVGVPPPAVTVLLDDDPVIATSGSRAPRIVVSRGLLDMLDSDAIRVALAHELAHVVRRSTALTIAVFLIRILMFYNPVTLIVFRQLVHDDEQACDEITARLTGAPRVFADVLRRFLTQRAAPSSSFRDLVEDRSHNLLLKDRIGRLMRGAYDADLPFPWTELCITAAAVLAVCYFVV
jgi:Zn-dependent protease with chaperone function